jgi:hypothetical protein
VKERELPDFLAFLLNSVSYTFILSRINLRKFTNNYPICILIWNQVQAARVNHAVSKCKRGIFRAFSVENVYTKSLKIGLATLESRYCVKKTHSIFVR